MAAALFLVFGLAFAGFLHQLALNSLLFPVQDGGRFFIIFPLFIFPNDAFLFNHTLKPFDCLFQHLIVIHDNMGHCNSPPFR
jgi:hypothetical protein